MKKLFTLRKLVLTAFLGLVAIGTAQAQYCTPTYSSNCIYGDDIDDFILAGDVAPGINNLGTPCPPGGYQDFTTMSATMTIGNTYNGNVTTNYSAAYENVRIWIDFNNNQTFEASETVATLADISNASTGAYSITIPTTVMPGTYRMRVRLAYATTPTNIDPCNLISYGECHDYTVNIVAAIACNDPTYSFPASATTEASPLEICTSGDVELSIATATPLAPASGITYQWQSSPNAGGPWTDLGAPTNMPTYTTNVTTSSYFRCIVQCSGSPSLTAAASSQVVVSNPGNAVGTSGSRCGPGTVNLTATGPTGTTLNWYEGPVGGASIGTGSPFLTPYITQTTTYYVGASVGGSGVTGNLPTIPQSGGNSCAGGTMFDLTPTVTLDIDSIAARVNGTGQEVKIFYRVGTFVGNETNASAWILHETIPAANAPVVASFQGIKLTTPLTLTGGTTYGIYIKYNSSYTNGNGTNQVTSNADLLFEGGVGLCSEFGGVNNPRIFNGTIFYSGSGCEGVRQPVVATVNPSTTVTYSFDSIVCNDVVTPISITSNVGTYSGYTWYPTDFLYTDAAGTVPYDSGSNASTVYFRSDVSGSHELYLMAGNPTLATACTYADTFSIWVQPGGITVEATPDTICVSGTSTLALVPEDNYYPGTIQWQESADGITYTDIPGATANELTTPNLTVEHYYRVKVSEGATNCVELDKHILIANPELLSTKDSFHCGPGTVILEAEAAPNTGLFWYAEQTGGIAIGTGSPFTTPYLLETDTFWVSAGVGGAAVDPTWIGTGTSTTTSQPNPFYTTYEANKNQYLVTAQELQDAGFTAGNILSLGFDVLGVTTTYTLDNFTIKIGHTNATALNTTFEAGLQEVYTNAAYSVQANAINSFVFDTPFPWDGTSNIVIETCFSNPDWGGSQTIRYTSTGFTSSHYQYTDGNMNHCTTPLGSNFTSSNRPNMLFEVVSGCETPRSPVIASIHPDPIVDLGADVNQCIDSGSLMVLNAGVQPNNPTFEWDNGNTSQVRAVGETGTYYVEVTNQWGCASTDTVNIILRENPTVDLGNDTTVCNGVTIELDAGTDGIEYFWNTGATSQTITVTNGGTYNVFVTNEEGCTSLDTVVVQMAGELPTVQGISIDNDGGYTFSFEAVNPQNVIGYEWDFGDGSSLSYEVAPTHTYPDAGNYIVTLKLSSSCGFWADSTSAHIVSVNQVTVDADELTIYPNPASESATIVTRGGLKMQKISMYNVVGQLIQTVEVDNRDKYLMSFTGLASGMYTLQIQTEKGVVTRKLEVVK